MVDILIDIQTLLRPENRLLRLAFMLLHVRFQIYLCRKSLTLTGGTPERICDLDSCVFVFVVSFCPHSCWRMLPTVTLAILICLKTFYLLITLSVLPRVLPRVLALIFAMVLALILAMVLALVQALVVLKVVLKVVLTFAYVLILTRILSSSPS